jgi:hypothetical protein
MLLSRSNFRKNTSLTRRTIAPGLTQTTVTVMPLNEPGTVFLDRVNQVDFAVSRDFRFGKMMVRPQFDFFNAFNSNAVTQVNTSYGPSLLQPQSILNPRLIRFNVRVSYYGLGSDPFTLLHM